MDEAQLRTLIRAAAEAVITNAAELTALDQAIGDGDHGINMKRGGEAVLAQLDALAAKPLPHALRDVGMALVMKVGGASGPLYGTLFVTLGKTLPPEPALADVVSAFGTAIEAVKKIGKSDTGQKTLLDVLVPVHDALAAGNADWRADLPSCAAAAAAATIPMRAIKGRASFLGERSVGHMDPGARSSSLIVAAICAAWNPLP